MGKFNRLTDRCDSCNAQAFVRVEKKFKHNKVEAEYELLFCAHHYNKHQFALDLQGFEVTDDERDKINDKPSISANAE